MMASYIYDSGSEEGLMSRTFPISEVYRKDMKPRLDDPYRAQKKHPKNTKCPNCGLMFQKGAWRLAKAQPLGAMHWKLCPACLQTRHSFAGGELKLSGSFLAEHHGEILNRIENVARGVVKEHPLERIMKMEERNDEIVIFVTSEHLAARLGKAIHSDFKGELVLKYARDDKYAVAHWRRDV